MEDRTMVPKHVYTPILEPVNASLHVKEELRLQMEFCYQVTFTCEIILGYSGVSWTNVHAPPKLIY